MSKVKEAIDNFFSHLVGEEQKRAVKRLKEHYIDSEENANLFNKLLDKLENVDEEKK